VRYSIVSEATFVYCEKMDKKTFFKRILCVYKVFLFGEKKDCLSQSCTNTSNLLEEIC
jgi:hypothetical protein